jgi:purine-binding chemotaxis protein CheW
VSTSAVIANDEEQLVAFRLNGERYGIPISAVHEIIRATEITHVPNTSPSVLGVFNLRGKIVPVIDLRMRLTLPVTEQTRSTRIVVVESEQGIVGMMVDAVEEVMRMRTGDIEPPAGIVAGVDTDYLRGVGKSEDGLTILLDLDKVLQNGI